jgi:hypothetical protein
MVEMVFKKVEMKVLMLIKICILLFKIRHVKKGNDVVNFTNFFIQLIFGFIQLTISLKKRS